MPEILNITLENERQYDSEIKNCLPSGHSLQVTTKTQESNNLPIINFSFDVEVPHKTSRSLQGRIKKAAFQTTVRQFLQLAAALRGKYPECDEARDNTNDPKESFSGEYRGLKYECAFEPQIYLVAVLGHEGISIGKIAEDAKALAEARIDTIVERKNSN